MPDSMKTSQATEKNNQPENGWPVIFSAMSFQAFTLGVYTYCFTFWILPWKEEFNASRAEVMLALMMGSLCLSLFSPIAGRMLDKKPVKLVVATGLIVYAVGLSLISQATALWQIIAIYALLLSFGISFSGPMAGQWLAVRWFHNRRGTAIGLVSIGSSIGGFLFPPAVTFFLGAYGWRATHLGLACTALIIFLPIILVVIREPRENSLPLAGVAGGAIKKALSAKEIIRSSQFWLMILTMIPLVMSLTLLTSNLAPFSADMGVATQKASFLMSTLAIGMIVGKVGVGILIDMMDFRRVYFVIIGLLAIGLFFMSTGPGYKLLLASCILIGLSAGSFLTLSASIISNLYEPESFGTVLGLVHLSNAWLAGLVPLSGLLREFTGSYTTMWVLLLIVALSATLPMSKLKPK